MWGSAVCGFLLGVGALLFIQTAPQPLGSILWWGFFAGPLLFLIESRLHRAKWVQWKQYMERQTAWDILKGRHIPDLRNGGA